MAIKLKSEDGQEILHRLVEEADVFVEGFRPGVMRRLGSDYETLRNINSRLIYCSLSGYGQDGPYRDLVGHDINFISFGGVLDLIGEAGSLPTIPLNFLADYAGASLHSVIGILLALMVRQKTGEGQYVDISYLDTVISLTANVCAAGYFSRGRVPQRGATPFSGGYPYYCVYQTKDNKLISIGCTEPWLWENLCRALGREDFIPYHQKPEHWERGPDDKDKAVKEQLKQVFLTRTRDEWFEFLAKHDVCVGKVYSWDEVFADPQVLHRHMLVELKHPALGTVRQVGIPIKLSKTPGSIRRVGPRLGEHTDEILQQIGFTVEAISELRQKGFVA